MHDILRLADLESDELFGLLELASAFKADRDAFFDGGRGRVVGVLFEKPSLRTRFSVEAALTRISAHAIGAYDKEVGLGSREPITDAGAVLAGYVDALVMRTSEHSRVEALADASTVPVFNALSDVHHPLQGLADLMTISEEFADADPRGLKGMRVAWVGDGNNVAHSLIEGCALSGIDIACACPPGFEPNADVVAWALDRGAVVELTQEPRDAVAGAVAVCTDVWTSMGQEDQAAGRRDAFEPYQVDEALMASASPGAIFLHCLPAHRGEEVSAAVIDGPASRVFPQAHNRMHTVAAVLLRTFGAA